MIKITKAKDTRKRDKKRNRVVIHIGDKQYHVTKEEACILGWQLINAYSKEFYKR